MRKAVVITILGAAASLGIQAGLSGHWWLAVICGLAAALWLAQSRESEPLAPAVSLLVLLGACTAGIYRGYHQLWTFTNLVLLLVTWDLDAFNRGLAMFASHENAAGYRTHLIQEHIKRLGLVTLVGWSLGAAALSVRISINFGIALVLASLAGLSLRGALRLMSENN